MESWYLRRKGYPETSYHLNNLLGNKEKLTIGRKKGGAVDIICNGQTVSREHCSLHFVNGYWQVKDLKSMNGVFVNKSKIPAGELIRLKLGDELGVGAMDAAIENYFIFDVCKMLIKDETQNEHQQVEIEEIFIADESISSPDRPNSDVNGMMVDLEQTVCAGPSKIISRSNQEIIQESRNEKLKQQCLSDPKLRMKCQVVVKRLPPIKRLRVKTTSSKKKKIVPVKGKKRICRIHSDEEESDEEELEQQESDDRSDSSDDSSAKSTSPICWIPTDQLDESMAAVRTKDMCYHPHCTTPRCSATTVERSKCDLNHRNNLEAQGLSKEISHAKFSSELYDVSRVKQEKEEQDDDIIVITPTVYHQENVDEPDVIELSSDEETFDVSRFRRATFDPTEPQLSTINQLEDPLMVTESVSPSVPEDDDRFFPELSQGILQEFEADEEREKADALEAIVDKDEKLNKILLESDRFKPKGKKTQFTTAKPIPHHQAGKRFTQCTARDTGVQRELPTEDESSKSKSSTHTQDSLASCSRPTEEDVSQPKSVKPTQKRTAQLIQAKPMGPKRKSKKDNSMRKALCDKDGLGGFVTANNQALRKSSSSIVHPANSNLAASSAKRNEKSDLVERTKPSKTVRPSPVPPPVKAKITKQSKNALLAAEFAKPTEDQHNEGIDGIGPKASKSRKPTHSDDYQSDDRSVVNNSAQKRKLPDEDVSSSPDACTGVSLSFKRQVKRIAHPNPDDDGKKNKSTPRRNVKIHDSLRNLNIHDGPRSSALPLGGKGKNLKPKFTSKAVRSNEENETSVNSGNKNSSVSYNGERLNGEPRPSTSRMTEEDIHNDIPSSSSSNASPIPNTDANTLDVPDKLSSLSRGGHSGILRLVPRERPHGRRIRFDETQYIREIEPREPKPKKKFPKTVMQRVNVQHLMDGILLRICCWSSKWIEEQKRTKENRPPPLLGPVTSSNNTLMLPKLSLLPVVSTYDNLEAYFTIFHPLMFHEIWANICKDIQAAPPWWHVKIHANPRSSGSCSFLKCETLVRNNSPRLKDFDLVTLCVTTPTGPVEVFAIAENVQIRFIPNMNGIDERLVACSSPDSDISISFDLRVKPTNVPPPPQIESNIFVVGPVSSLRPVIKQFLVHGNLFSSPLCDVVLNPVKEADAFKLDMVEVDGSPKMDVVQEQAVESITRTVLNTEEDEPKVVLVQGLPGTGKSHVIVELVLRMICMHYVKHENTEKPRILICAPSNNAIDEIAIRLIEARDERKIKFRLVRVGASSAMHPKVARISLDVQGRKRHLEMVARSQSPESLKIKTLEEELKNLLATKQSLFAMIHHGNEDEKRMHARKLDDVENRIDTLKKPLADSKKIHLQYFTHHERKSKVQIVDEAHVICATLNTCRGKEMDSLFLNGEKNDKNKRFLCCIIDEASLCTEPESLTPLAFNISKLVMIGDPDQVQTTLASQGALKNGFVQSLFNRFFNARIAVTGENYEPVLTLDTQYRMAESICRWPSKYFYGGKLKTAAGLSRDGSCHSYRVLNVFDGHEEVGDEGDGKSIVNSNEAALIVNITKVINDQVATQMKSIGILTFFPKQRQVIEARLRKVFLDKEADRIEVNTVDGFQGREKDIIIISCVRAQQHSNGDIGSIGSPYEMNVALTRAKESLIVCGHFPTLQKSEAWNDLISDAKSRPDVVHNVMSSFTSIYLKPLVLR